MQQRCALKPRFLDARTRRAVRGMTIFMTRRAVRGMTITYAFGAMTLFFYKNIEKLTD